MTLRMLIRQLQPALLAVVALTLVCGVAYPLITTLVGRAAFNEQTGGSLIRVHGVVVGSKLIGQPFASPRYFHPRPSAAGNGYDGSASGGSNLGPLNPDLLSAVQQRVSDYRAENGLAADARVPVDAVTSSGSGLDPHISVANARLQAGRVAKARGLSADVVAGLIDTHTQDRILGVLGEPGVNVLELNIALDQLAS
jgi:K+-transporting ATPase ATPase C chain